MAAIFARKESRELLRERGRNSLDYFNHKAEKLRERAGGIVKTGMEFIGRRHGDSVKSDTEAEKQAYREEPREMLGG